MSKPACCAPGARILLLLCLVGLTLQGCSTDGGQRAQVHAPKAHPLTGQLFRAGSDTPVPFAALLETMQTVDVIYLGETHDNPSHHHIEQQVVFQLIDQGLRPALGFEFFSREQTSHLIRYRNGGKRHGAGDDEERALAAERLLRAQLGWHGNRETDWQRFLPLLRKARELQLPLFGADLPAGIRVNLARYGYQGLNGVERLTTTRSTFDDPVHREWMLERLGTVHCGHGNVDFAARLYETWLARNEAMAEAIVAMVRDNPGQPVVVIMGGGHLEYNLGVYERVQHLMPEARQLNIRMFQVLDDFTEPADYFAPLVRAGRDFGPPHEYLWFTSGPPRQVRACPETPAASRPAAEAEHATDQ